MRVSSGHAAARVGFMKASGARLPAAVCAGLRPSSPQALRVACAPSDWSRGFRPPLPGRRAGLCLTVWHPLASLLTISLLQGRLLLEKFSFIDFYF